MTPGTVWPGLRVATFYELTDILVPLAGRLYLPALREPELLPNRETAALAMH